ncbi:MAG: TolC family protein, partial [Planctomycetota bacterium]
ARLALSYTHPLRRGSGQFYNNSLIVLAQIDANIAQDEFLRQLQSHLLEVTRAYWSLYLERASLVQQERLYQRSKSTLEDVRGRQVMDATNSQLIRVQAAVADRRASLVRAQTAVRNAQERVIALVNDPELNQVGSLELVPLDAPTDFLIPVDMETSVRTALRSRPEVSQALRQIHAGCRRLGMARNEMLPQLDLVLRGYLAGLSGNDDVGRAWVEQFTEGEPSYSVGLNYEIPIGNRLARARMKRRRLEVRQLRNQFDTTVETLLLEVKTAVREVDTAFREMVAKYQSMVAADLQLNSIQERWKALPGEGKSAALYLEDLLDAQQKLTTIENEYLTANATYNLALMNLKKAQGTLLLDENILVGEANLDCLPTIQLHKANDLARTSETPPLERFDTEKSVQQQSVATVVDVKENGPTIPKMAKVKSVKATSRKVTSRRPWKRNTPEKILKFAGRSGPNKSALVRQSSKSFKEAPRTKPSKSNKVESFVEPIFDKGLQPQPQDARYASSPSVVTRR